MTQKLFAVLIAAGLVAVAASPASAANKEHQQLMADIRMLQEQSQTLQNLLKAVSQSLYMDQSLDPLKLAEQMQALTAGNLSFSTIPTDGFADVPGVGSTVVVNPAEVKTKVRQLVAATASTPHTSAPAAVAPSSVTVDVLNGTGEDGVAARNASALQKAGLRSRRWTPPRPRARRRSSNTHPGCSRRPPRSRRTYPARPRPRVRSRS
jgi:hypothetical protein